MWYLIPNIYKNTYVQCFCLIEQTIIGQIKLIYKPDKKGLRFCFHRSPFNFFFPVKERKASYEYRIVRSISASRIRTANTRASVDVSYRRWQKVLKREFDVQNGLRVKIHRANSLIWFYQHFKIFSYPKKKISY